MLLFLLLLFEDTVSQVPLTHVHNRSRNSIGHKVGRPIDGAAARGKEKGSIFNIFEKQWIHSLYMGKHSCMPYRYIYVTMLMLLIYTVCMTYCIWLSVASYNILMFGYWHSFGWVLLHDTSRSNMLFCLVFHPICSTFLLPYLQSKILYLHFKKHKTII